MSGRMLILARIAHILATVFTEQCFLILMIRTYSLINILSRTRLTIILIYRLLVLIRLLHTEGRVDGLEYLFEELVHINKIIFNK
jgi:hypothetical protein